MSWAINPNRSLFHYELGENATFYSMQNQFYLPSFIEPTAGPMEANARQVCGIPLNSTNSSQWSAIQRTCYYDISVTRDLDFGRISRQAAEQQIEQREAMRNPPKFISNLPLTKSVRIGEQVRLRAPDGSGWAEQNEPMGKFIFYQPSPPWAGPKFASPAHALTR